MELDNKSPELSNKKCPRCGKHGSGPYTRWVRNSQGKRYEPYLYFAHREGSRLKWCYLGKKKLDNKSDSNNTTTLSNFSKKRKCSP
jgi:hypothetical protein